VNELARRSHDVSLLDLVDRLLERDLGVTLTASGPVLRRDAL
jgi:hypothetical protein